GRPPPGPAGSGRGTRLRPTWPASSFGGPSNPLHLARWQEATRKRWPRPWGRAPVPRGPPGVPPGAPPHAHLPLAHFRPFPAAGGTFFAWLFGPGGDADGTVGGTEWSCSRRGPAPWPAAGGRSVPATRARGQGHRARPGQGVPQSWPLLGQEDTCSLTGRLIHQRVTEGGAIDKRPSEQGCSAREGHQRREGAAADRLARTQRGGPTARSQALSTNSLKEISMYEVKRHSCLYLGLELAVAASLAAAPTTSAGPIRIERTFANN